MPPTQHGHCHKVPPAVGGHVEISQWASCTHRVSETQYIYNADAQKTKQRAVMTLEEFAERIELAVADGEHQGVIGALFGSGVHGGGRFRAFKHGRAGMNMDFFDDGNHGGGRQTWLMLPGETARGGKSYRVSGRVGARRRAVVRISANLPLAIAAQSNRMNSM